MSLLNLYFIGNYFSYYCYKGSTFQRETIIEPPLFQSKLQHIRYHRYGLCLNYIQRYSYSLLLMQDSLSNVLLLTMQQWTLLIIFIHYRYSTSKAPTCNKLGLVQQQTTDMGCYQSNTLAIMKRPIKNMAISPKRSNTISIS